MGKRARFSLTWKGRKERGNGWEKNTIFLKEGKRARGEENSRHAADRKNCRMSYARGEDTFPYEKTSKGGKKEWHGRDRERKPGHMMCSKVWGEKKKTMAVWVGKEKGNNGIKEKVGPCTGGKGFLLGGEGEKDEDAG